MVRLFFTMASARGTEAVPLEAKLPPAAIEKVQINVQEDVLCWP